MELIAFLKCRLQATVIDVLILEITNNLYYKITAIQKKKMMIYNNNFSDYSPVENIEKILPGLSMIHIFFI